MSQEVPPPPVVSIIVPTYQRAHLVGQAIASVLDQSYQDFEIIVVVDGSTDDTLAHLARLAQSQRREKITIISQTNAGLAAARNAGIRAAQGRFLAFLDDDDLWLPDKLAAQVAVFAAQPEVGLVFGDMICFDEQGERAESYAQTTIPPRILNEITLFWYNYVPLSTVIIRRACLDEFGLFDETLTACEDMGLWLRISAKWRLWRLADPVARYRLSANAMHNDFGRVITNSLRVKANAYERSPAIRRLPMKLLDRYFYNLFLDLARHHMKRLQWAHARNVLAGYLETRGATPAAVALLAEINTTVQGNTHDDAAAPGRAG